MVKGSEIGARDFVLEGFCRKLASGSNARFNGVNAFRLHSLCSRKRIVVHINYLLLLDIPISSCLSVNS